MSCRVRLLGGLVCGVCMVGAGCTAGRYDADYAEALVEFQESAPFAVLEAQASEIGTEGLSLRLPEGFLLLTQPAAAPEGPPAARLDPSRLRPPFLREMPGYRQTFERRYSVGNAEFPVSLAIGVIPAAASPRQAVEKMILERARADESFADAKPAWEDREVAAKAGGPAAWRVLSLTGSQTFESVVAGVEQYKPQPGSCQLWLSADPEQEQQILLVWRYPEEVAELFPLPPAVMAETLARTVAIEPADEPALGDESAAGDARAENLGAGDPGAGEGEEAAGF